MFWLLLLIVAALCGSIGARIGGRPYSLGCIGSIALGFIGAALGGWIAGKLNLPPLLEIDLGGGTTFPTVYAVMGSAIFVAVLGLFRGRGGDEWGPNDG
ncbi:MAG TPA: GlsB/YeaQ/YmgE family stress response membrane protein [Patescibacteria group bacterium]|jgi:uncharacterized membrane protein YeaQ/YmgE (transglycosylase-associated protein family)|nr:GlsB/YeaQ/YmgE family stress response membrane protein [Patescibacteria group bacterium]